MRLLGVNIDHVATLRQARYATMLESPNAEPDVLAAADAAIAGGADSITVHPRGDGRHIQREDVRQLKGHLRVPLNMEMANTDEMLDFALEVLPAYACLVPEKREEVTTEGGLDVISHQQALAKTIPQLQKAGIKVSLFIDPDKAQVLGSSELGADMVELHTGAFANARAEQRKDELGRLIAGARLAEELGLQVNAGHGINYHNIEELFSVPHLVELNIGHALVTRALFTGLETAVRDMRAAMQRYPL